MDEPIDLPTTLEDTCKLKNTLYKQGLNLVLSHCLNQATNYKEWKEAFVLLYKLKLGSEERAVAIFDQNEETKQMMLSLPKIKTKGGGGITSVLVSLLTCSEELLWHSVTDGLDIKRFVFDCKIQHFSSAGETLLATNEIIDMLGFGGNTETSQKFLAGEGNIPNITNNKTSKLLLHSMKRDTDPIVLDFTATNMMNRYKIWKEKTVMSVASGRHLGHFHALFCAFKFSNRDDYDNIVEKQQSIIDLHYLILCISTNNEYCYERWKTMVTQMIEEDPGCPKLSHFQVIDLYKCNLNLHIGLYFRKFSQHLEDNNLLNPGTYGGHPNCCAIDPVIIDVTQTKIAMIT